MSRLPAWLEPLYTADEMRALDAWAIHDEGVPSLELMERAGAEVVRVVTADGARPARCASCAARATTAATASSSRGCWPTAGLEAEALLLSDPDELSADARANFDRLAGTRRAVAPGRCRPPCADALAGSGAVVDAMLGTGFEGAPRAPLDAAIEAVNAAGAPVVAVDVPSGVNASTGEVEGACVRADVTVTFHARQGRACGWIPGKSRCRPGGGGADRHPARARTERPPPRTAGLIAAAGARRAAAPRGGVDQVLLRLGAGGRRLDRPHRRGLPRLRGRDARRRGLGARRRARVAQRGVRGEAHRGDVGAAARRGRRAAGRTRPTRCSRRRSARTRSCSGPGLGRAEESFALAVELIERIERPLLIDADGLNALAGAGLERAAGRVRADGADAARGRAGAAARPAVERRSRRTASRRAREAAERVGRGRGAEGRRHARGPARGRAGRHQPRAAPGRSRRPAPATC